MSEIKYLMDGTAVYVIETLQSGFLVEKLYSRGGGDEEEPMADGSNPIRVPQVFDVAPTEVCDKHVAALETRIGELEAKRKELDQQERSSASAAKEVAAKLARNEKLARLMDFIDGKITHYVEDDYSGPRIIAFKDATCAGDGDERAERRSLRLLTLYGGSNGDLNWRLDAYKDGSGGDRIAVVPATSYEEALKILTRLLVAKMEKGPRAEWVKVADQYSIAIPDEYRESVRAMLANNLRTCIAKAHDERVKLESELASLEAVSLGGGGAELVGDETGESKNRALSPSRPRISDGANVERLSNTA
jgi:hypothetical protein